MNRYEVRIPVAGYLEAFVVAESEDDALEKAMELDSDHPDVDLSWESMKHIVQGNIFYGPLAHYEVILLGPDDEDN